MQKTSKAFSFVEIIITISIISLLAIIGISSKQRYDENVNNSKIVSDIETINNALTSFSEDVKSLPMPGGNTNFYSADTSYKHSFEDPDTFGVYGSITEKTIPKKYLDILPLDPRTNSYYAYGKTKSLNQFEVASVQYVDTLPITKVVGNYTAETGPYNLIREYNGPNFVYDRSNANFPYNPDELVLIVTDQNGVVYREGDTINSGTGDLEIFYSDGSVSILEPGTTITLNKLNFKGEDNLNSFVKIALGAGTIWTRATKLNDESSFEVYTSDTNATVRGTIFKVTLTDITVIEGQVDIYKTTTSTPQLVEEINVPKGEVPQIYTINSDSLSPGTNLELPDFTKGTDPRDTETVENVLKDAEALKEELAKNDDIQIDADCSTFTIDGEGCISSDQTLISELYKLVAYAPYNQVGDLYLYGSGGIKYETKTNYISAVDNNGRQYYQINGSSSNISGDDLSSYGEVLSKESSLVKASSGEKGIVPITTGYADYLMYNISDLNLLQNYAIEMSVKGKDLKRNNSDKYYLWYSSDINMGIYIISGKLKFLNNGSSTSGNYISSLNINDDFFYNVTYKQEGLTYKILINNIEYLSGSINNYNLNNIYIGNWIYYDSMLNKYKYVGQWNGIINLVKIYKKS